MKLNRAWILILMFPFSVFANESGGEAAKKDEPKADKPWVESQNAVSALTTKTKQLSEKLHELIEEKKKANAEHRREIDKEIDVTYKQLKESNADLRRQEQIYRYRFPERAAKEGERSYNTEEIPSLQKIEEQVGIEGKINRNLRRMRSQYGKTAKEKSAPSEVVPEAPSPTPEQDKNIREQDSPILKK